MDSPFAGRTLVPAPMKKIAVHFARETGGRWIAEAEGFPGVLAYGATRAENSSGDPSRGSAIAGRRTRAVE